MTSRTPGHQDDLALSTLYDHLGANLSAGDALAATVKKFPEQAALLVDATLSQEAVAREPDLKYDELAVLDNAIQKVLQTHRPAEADSLRQLVTLSGLSDSQVASHLNIGETVLKKLYRSLILVGSIPTYLIVRLADLLVEPVESIASCLTVHQNVRVEAKSVRKPEPKQQSFEAAMKTSLEMGEIDQADFNYWKSQPGEAVSE